MNRRSLGLFILSLALFLGVSCTKLGEPVQGEQTMVLQPLPKIGSIPANWGKLISASTSAAAKEWIQLWFQDEAGIVRMVSYNLETNTLADKAVLFPRD